MASTSRPPGSAFDSTPPEGFLPESIAILPLRNSVLLPMSVVPINVGRPCSVRLVEEFSDDEQTVVGVIAQRDPEVVEPAFEDLYEVGTLARVVKQTSGKLSVPRSRSRLRGAARRSWRSSAIRPTSAVASPIRQ